MSSKKLAIIALGKRNAGKSNTWYEIFGRVIRSGLKRLSLNGKKMLVSVKNSSFEESGDEIEGYFDVFVINASNEESGYEIEDYLDVNNLPSIVFCSVQYVEDGLKTIDWFKDHEYYLYIQWINPGHHDHTEYNDYLEFERRFHSSGTFTKCSGKEKAQRGMAIVQFLSQWIKSNK